MKKQILIVEDEQRAGEKLIDLVKEKCPEAMIRWKRTVADGITFIKEHQELDLIFSDIELLDGNAFEIYDVVQPNCPIIFTTAYNDFYLDAFNTTGIAYLLKPYSKEQFSKAWKKYDQLFSKNSQEQMVLPNQLLEQLKQAIDETKTSYKQTFSVKKKSGVFLLKTSSISYLQAQGDFIFAFDQSGVRHTLNQTLSGIEEQLDPQLFYRINRSEIVCVTNILRYENYTKSRLAISLSKPEIVLYTSNSRSSGFKLWLEEH